MYVCIYIYIYIDLGVQCDSGYARRERADAAQASTGAPIELGEEVQGEASTYMCMYVM